MRHMKVSFCALLLTFGLVGSSFGQATFNVSGGSGQPGSFLDSSVTFDTTSAASSWSLAVCHDAANLTLLSTELGAVGGTVNNGGPPDFEATNEMPLVGTGYTQGVIISFGAAAVLPAAAGQEIIVAHYELIGVPVDVPIVTFLEFCPDLGSPVVPNSLVLVDTTEEVLTFNNGEVTIIPPPDYCLDLTCTGGVTDAELTWDICSDFSYITVSRNGELLDLLPGTATGYSDPGLAPGTYHYAVIGVAFPDPIGSPTIIVSECDVDIIPVTINTEGGISPTSAAYQGGETLTITGTGFLAALDTVITIDGVECPTTVIDDFMATCTIPATTILGTVDIGIMNSLGSDLVPDGLLYGFIRGRITPGDADIDLGDPLFTLEYLFIGGPTPECIDAVDVNDDGVLTLSDPLYLLEFLFVIGPQPFEPFATPGLDPTPGDPFGCLNILP